MIKDWSVSAPSQPPGRRHEVPRRKTNCAHPGRYYIYAQRYYKSTGRVLVCVNNSCVTMLQPLTSANGHGVLYTAGVFNLKAGDVISLDMKTSITLAMNSYHSYLGAFLI